MLLAGLYAEGETTVVEPAPTRDHTERMLAAAGAHVAVRPTSVTVSARASGSRSARSRCPGDFSSAAPFVVAATLVPGSELHVHGVNLNPRRTGLLEILERMGAKVTVYNRREIGGEPGGDLEVHSAPLVGTTVGAKEVPLAIDELPLFALAAACARGESRCAARRSCARRRPTASRRPSTRCARSASARARATTASRSRASRRGSAAAGCESRRPPRRDARRRGRARLARRGAGRGRGGGRRQLPGLLRDARRAPPRVGRRRGRAAATSLQRDDRGDRRARGAGKSSVARALADRLGFRYLDTGAMYRALTWLALHEGVPARRRACARGARGRASGRVRRGGQVEIAGEDVTRRIREPEIDAAVPVVARHPEVREVMRGRQRELGRSGDSVIEGRDIGVVVVPEAELKVWLVADPAVRARAPACRARGARRRRARRGARRRDERDAANTHRAPDAVEVDTTSMTLDEVIERIVALVGARR